MMLEWLGQKHGMPEATKEASRLTRAVDAAFATGKLHSCELGGQDGSRAITDAIIGALAKKSALA